MNKTSIHLTFDLILEHRRIGPRRLSVYCLIIKLQGSLMNQSSSQFWFKSWNFKELDPKASLFIFQLSSCKKTNNENWFYLGAILQNMITWIHLYIGRERIFFKNESQCKTNIPRELKRTLHRKINFGFLKI